MRFVLVGTIQNQYGQGSKTDRLLFYISRPGRDELLRIRMRMPRGCFGPQSIKELPTLREVCRPNRPCRAALIVADR